jgi:hypothetical protein
VSIGGHCRVLNVENNPGLVGGLPQSWLPEGLLWLSVAVSCAISLMALREGVLLNLA